MTIKTVFCAAAAAVCLFVVGSSALSQEEPPGMEGMKRWMETMKPGPHHARLERLLGKYDVTMRMQMGAPQPIESKGTAETKWLYDGKWAISSWDIPIMGMPFKYTWILGYDNNKKSYVSTVINSQETDLKTSEGDATEDGDTIILWGTINEPMSGEHDKMVKTVIRLKSADEHVVEIHDMPIGEENTKVVEFTFTRKTE